MRLRGLHCVFAIMFALAACSTGDERSAQPVPTPNPQSPALSPSSVPGDVASAPCEGGPIDDELEAEDLSFQPRCLNVRANRVFTLEFKNHDDRIRHSLVVEGAAGGGPLFAGRIITGRDEIQYEIPAIDVGTYVFRCGVHQTMVGTLVAD
jgi:plastocyanin